MPSTIVPLKKNEYNSVVKMVITMNNAHEKIMYSSNIVKLLLYTENGLNLNNKMNATPNCKRELNKRMYFGLIMTIP